MGTDLNATMIDLARERHPVGTLEAEYLAADVSSLRLEDVSFDHAFLQQGLQFFPDKPAVLREIARVLRPGGCLVLTTDGADQGPSGRIAPAGLRCSCYSRRPSRRVTGLVLIAWGIGMLAMVAWVRG